MRKILFIIAIFFTFGINAQTFTPIHNYQAPDGLAIQKYAGIPHGDTATFTFPDSILVAGVKKKTPALMFQESDSTMYIHWGKWIAVKGGGGSVPFNVDSIVVSVVQKPDSCGDWWLNWKGDTILTHTVYPCGSGGGGSGSITNGIIDPLLVTWSGTGLVFDISAGSFIYNNVVSYVGATQVTLDAADPTYPRIDAFYVDTLGNVGKITGVAEANPVSPQVVNGQFLLTTVYIAAGATVPDNVSFTDIYLENTEWTTSKTGTGTVDFNDASNPYQGSKDIKVSGASGGLTLIFTNPSTIDTTNIGDVLRLFLYTATPLPSGYTFQFFSGTNPVSYPLSINAIGFGYNPTTLSTYQNISIPFSAFTFTSPYYNILKITNIGANANPVYWDNIQIQKGMYQYAPTDYSNKVDSVTLEGSNQYYWVKGSRHFVGVVGGGGSGGTVTSVSANLPLSVTNPTTTPNITADTSKSQGNFATFNDVLTHKDSSAYHTSQVIGDSLLVLCDLLGRCDTISMAAINLWQRNGNKIYYNNGNVGIGTDTAMSLLNVQSKETTYNASLNDTSALILSGYANATSGSTINYSPGLIFSSNSWDTSTNTVRNTRFKLEASAVNSSTYPLSASDLTLKYYDNGSYSTLWTFGGTGRLSFGSTVLNSSSVISVNGTFSSSVSTPVLSVTNRGGIGSAFVNSDGQFQLNTTGTFIPPRLTTASRDSLNLTVTSITIVNAGTGYTTAPTLSFSGSYTFMGNTSFAVATATVAAGSITGTTITTPGHYIQTPTITVTGGGGSGAILKAVVTQVLTTGATIFCTDCTATDSSTGVMQTWNGTAWKNNW